jgi:hypothetical protein
MKTLQQLIINHARLLLLIVATGTISPYAVAQNRELLIFGGESNKEFLGCLTCSETAANSVWNDISQYGWGNSFGKWNSFGPYKNPFSSHSACNEYASTPPIIVTRDGNVVGRLTTNQYTTSSVCGVLGNKQICQALKVLCSAE